MSQISISAELIKLLYKKNFIFVNEIKEVPSVFNEKNVRELNRPVIMFNADLNQIGYRLTPEALYSMTMYDVIYHYEKFLHIKKGLISKDGAYFKPFYQDFPNGVMKRSDEELFIHQILHYLSDGTYTLDIIPLDNVYSNSHVIKAVSKQNYIDIKPIDINGLYTLIRNLCMSETALMPIDKEILKLAAVDLSIAEIMNFDGFKIPFKETLCFLMDYWDIPGETITDYLRYIFYINDGDITLASKNCRFKKMSRMERKKFMCNFNNFLAPKLVNESVNYLYDDVKKNIDVWLRFAKHIHAGEYKNSYPFAWEFFNHIRNYKITTAIGTFNNAVANNDFDTAINIMMARPGMFARNLNMLIEHFGADVIKNFKEVASKCSFNVLYGLLNYFLSRNELLAESRSIYLKGQSTPVDIEPLKEMDKNIIHNAIMACVAGIESKIQNISASKNSITDNSLSKKVYFDKNLQNIPLGRSMRTLSEDAKVQCPRGTKFFFEDNEYMRFYVHWIDKNGCEDLDLSAKFYSEDFNTEMSISWDSYHKDAFAIFSGDVRHVRGNCAEYIDVNIPKAIDKGYRYIVINVNNFEGRTFDTLDCWCGWEERSELENEAARQELWAPAKVKNGFKLTNNTTTHEIMCIVDLYENCVYLVDEGCGSLRVASNKSYVNLIKRLTFPYINIYDLLRLNLGTAGFTFISDEEYERLKVAAESGDETAKNSFDEILKISFDDVLSNYSIVYPFIYPAVTE